MNTVKFLELTFIFMHLFTLTIGRHLNQDTQIDRLFSPDSFSEQGGDEINSNANPVASSEQNRLRLRAGNLEMDRLLYRIQSVLKSFNVIASLEDIQQNIISDFNLDNLGECIHGLEELSRNIRTGQVSQPIKRKSSGVSKKNKTRELRVRRVLWSGDSFV